MEPLTSIVVISKNETALAATLTALEGERNTVDEPVEILVVDASESALDEIRLAHPAVRWIDFERPPRVRITIPHQRNLGVRESNGDVVVFTDAGCVPQEGWLKQITWPIRSGQEEIVSGVAPDPNGTGLYYQNDQSRPTAEYIDETPTINLAFTRRLFDQVGGFDEDFEYGSDVDFSWRVRDLGVRILRRQDIVVTHDWGDTSRQFRRAFLYGQARARLYKKHRSRMRHVISRDPVAFIYPLFLVLLPVSVVAPWFPLLLLIPMFKNRHSRPFRTVADHVVYACGVIVELCRSVGQR